MAIAVTLDSPTPKYKNTALDAAQQTALKSAIETFLKDKEADLAKTPDQEKPFTLLDFPVKSDTKVAVDFSVTKYVKDGATTVKVKEVDAPQKSVALPPINVLAGAEEFLDDSTPQTHVGIAITLQSDGDKLSVLTIPDVGKVKDGGSPVFLTKPVVLKLEKLKTFLEKKQVTLPDAVQNLLKDTSLSCDAFYAQTNNGPLLMVFQIQFNKGLISSLTGDDDIGELFDIKGAAVRVFRCSKEKFPVLQAYAAELRGEQTAIAATEKPALG